MDAFSEGLSASGVQSSIQRNARDRAKREAYDRRRSILCLILAYLREQSLSSTAECLQDEAQLGNDLEVCDNVDLDTVLQEYQSYYCAKFGKPPKITKRTKLPAAPAVQVPPKEVRRRPPPPAKVPEVQDVQEFQFEVRGLGGGDDDSPKLCDLEGYSGESREMADAILKEVVPGNLGVKWEDCIGLDECVQLLKEAVVYPLLHPGLFTGLVAPWRGVLLYGPPGTGKTLLSKAVACESRTKFFNISSSGFVHKWRGDSEKMLKVLFDVAKRCAPSTIFIDELDALTSAGDIQHDASRRFRSELLVQLDGILNDDRQLFVLATTNRPWDLDPAVLRRFEKRVLVDLPCEAARRTIFRYYFTKNGDRFAEVEYREMAARSLEFSGSDIKTACREACMSKLRKELERATGTKMSSSPSIEDVVRALSGIRPVTNAGTQEKYKKWRDDYGSH